VGQVPVEGYEFEDSKAVVGGRFVGLPLDEDFEPELTRGRVEKWIRQLERDFTI
jgi:flavodoxin I